MSEERLPSEHAGTGEPPIPVPPVDQSWSLMRSALDVRMPVTKPFYLRPRLWGGVVLGATVTLIVLKTILPHSPVPIRSTVPRTSTATGARDGVRNADSTSVTNGPVTTPISAAASQTATLPLPAVLPPTASARPPAAVPALDAKASHVPHHLVNKRADPSSNPTLTGANRRFPTNFSVTRPGKGATGTNSITTSSPSQTYPGQASPGQISLRQTFPVHLANLGSPLAVVRFSRLDSLLRKRGLRPNGPIPKTAFTSPRSLAFSAGITIPEQLDLGQQRAAPYTINGARNIWADYLPSAHIRAYSGDSWDLQLDLGLFQPQYTRSQVIDSTGGDSSSISPFQGYRQYNVYAVKKLFYSQVSLSLHRQLYKGIWLGAGITYGHLQGAVGNRQVLLAATNPGVSDTILNSEVVSIRTNDTAYNRLSKSDWRILFDAEYRYQRLTIGVRYERALNPYLPVQADGSKGTQRNASFTLRGSFELWQRRR